MPNREIHSGIGSIAGGGYALYLSKEQQALHQLIETVGGAIAGNFLGQLPDILEPAYNPRHRSLAHGVLLNTALGIGCVDNLKSWQTSLRFKADRQKKLKEQALDDISLALHTFLELFFRLLAGAVAGAIAGYGSHLLLDAFTPQSLPLIA